MAVISNGALALPFSSNHSRTCGIRRLKGGIHMIVMGILVANFLLGCIIWALKEEAAPPKKNRRR